MERICHKAKSKKIKWLVVSFSILLILLVIAMLVSSVLLARYNIRSGDISVVRGISTRMIEEDTVELNIKYQFPVGGYSVRLVPEDEGEYVGDGMVDYDGSLGKYRMIVDFGDMAPSTAMAMKFVLSETIVLRHTPITIRAKIAKPSDHGFVLYLGFDEPIDLETVECGEMDPSIESIKIPIKIRNIDMGE